MDKPAQIAQVPLIMDVPLSHFTVAQWQDGKLQQAQDDLAEETPVALIYNGVSHAVMLATAQDLEDFALGFSLSEGIVSSASELYSIETQQQRNGIELHCEIASERFVELKQRRRTLAGKTGCGLCGAESLEQAVRYPKPLVTEEVFSASVIARGLAAIQSQQGLQQKTGATHASAYVLADGSIYLLREDVGRHNALDKLVGALEKIRIKQLRLPSGFVITTSRASFEMVQKTASAGVAMLVAVSAPTGLAVRVAEQCGLTLVGFARKDRYVVYSHGGRILNE
ncbi:MAG TPA: formate dehydrogenase accessory sulfurtransferase FdhD [Methylotenera sp.]|nr:formate dehydrogenase accessory sulfurtransferase FdhD [Methylotenera sp.]HQS43992.1 formate dehydrogenase accessory sulfurtransferase FdhD [Methylotenera sp.]